jgi:hypothetical protein
MLHDQPGDGPDGLGDNCREQPFRPAIRIGLLKPYSRTPSGKAAMCVVPAGEYGDQPAVAASRRSIVAGRHVGVRRQGARACASQAKNDAASLARAPGRQTMACGALPSGSSAAGVGARKITPKALGLMAPVSVPSTCSCPRSSDLASPVRSPARQTRSRTPIPWSGPLGSDYNRG